jgi:peptide/nickel transport system substrate-binding protein
MSRSVHSWLRIAVVIVALSLVWPLAANHGAAQGEEKILRVHVTGYPDVVDPRVSSYVNELAILGLVYEGLTRLDTNQETVPAAAESWKYSDDATSITFTLREGMTYSDGSQLTAERFRGRS